MPAAISIGNLIGRTGNQAKPTVRNCARTIRIQTKSQFLGRSPRLNELGKKWTNGKKISLWQCADARGVSGIAIRAEAKVLGWRE